MTCPRPLTMLGGRDDHVDTAPPLPRVGADLLVRRPGWHLSFRPLDARHRHQEIDFQQRQAIRSLGMLAWLQPPACHERTGSDRPRFRNHHGFRGLASSRLLQLQEQEHAQQAHPRADRGHAGPGRSAARGLSLRGLRGRWLGTWPHLAWPGWWRSGPPAPPGTRPPARALKGRSKAAAAWRRVSNVDGPLGGTSAACRCMSAYRGSWTSAFRLHSLCKKRIIS